MSWEQICFFVSGAVLVLTVALLINSMIIEILLLVVFGLCISTLAMFAIILYDQIEQYVG